MHARCWPVHWEQLGSQLFAKYHLDMKSLIWWNEQPNLRFVDNQLYLQSHSRPCNSVVVNENSICGAAEQQLWHDSYHTECNTDGFSAVEIYITNIPPILTIVIQPLFVGTGAALTH